MNNPEIPFSDLDYDQGKKLIENLDIEGFSYPIIFWINLPDIKEWKLLFGIPGLKLIGKDDIIGNMKRIIRENELELSAEKISLIDTSDPLCIAMKSAFNFGSSGKILKAKMSAMNVNGFQLPETVICRII